MKYKIVIEHRPEFILFPYEAKAYEEESGDFVAFREAKTEKEVKEEMIKCLKRMKAKKNSREIYIEI